MSDLKRWEEELAEMPHGALPPLNDSRRRTAKQSPERDLIHAEWYRLQEQIDAFRTERERQNRKMLLNYAALLIAWPLAFLTISLVGLHYSR